MASVASEPDLPRIISFGGLPHAGKDSHAKLLIDKHGYRRLAFADKLKEMVSKETGLPLEWFHDPGKKDVPLKSLVQGISTPLQAKSDSKSPQTKGDFESFSKETTLRSLMIAKAKEYQKINKLIFVTPIINQLADGKRYVITDLNRQFELQALRKAYYDKGEFCSIWLFRPPEGNEKEETLQEGQDLKGSDMDICLMSMSETHPNFTSWIEKISLPPRTKTL